MRVRFARQARQLHAVSVATGIPRQQRDFLDDLMIVASPNVHLAAGARIRDIRPPRFDGSGLIGGSK